MIVEKNYDGALIISDMVNGYLFTMKYYGYTKKQALQLFRRAKKEEAKK